MKLDVITGELVCQKCKTQYPILGGVAILLSDVAAYLVHHVKGISQLVPDSEIPKKYLRDYLFAKAEIEEGHIEDDLEAARVISLYFMNHYLTVKAASNEWWKAENGPSSPLIAKLIQEYWDHGPFEQIQVWLEKLNQNNQLPNARVLELGCGVGGLYSVLKSGIGSYLGLDQSFASIALARHLHLGAPYPGKIMIPQDLLAGVTSREMGAKISLAQNQSVDWIVSDFAHPPLEFEGYDICIALNLIDMLDHPHELPKMQSEVLKKGGIAIQSSPYIWNERAAKQLRSHQPASVKTSAKAVEHLYTKAGFRISDSEEHIPWLFFKNLRQLEVYSVHAFMAVKGDRVQ